MSDSAFLKPRSLIKYPLMMNIKSQLEKSSDCTKPNSLQTLEIINYIKTDEKNITQLKAIKAKIIKAGIVKFHIGISIKNNVME